VDLDRVASGDRAAVDSWTFEHTQQRLAYEDAAATAPTSANAPTITKLRL
jgi:hypothetical protein